MTLLPCGHDPARQFWGKCGVCGISEPMTYEQINGVTYERTADGRLRLASSPTVREPRTDLRDAGDCGGAYHYGLCNSCGTYISVVPETARPIDVERLRRALWETDVYWRFANDEHGHGDLTRFADDIAAEYARLSGEEG